MCVCGGGVVVAVAVVVVVVVWCVCFRKFEKTMKMRMISTARTSASATTKTVNHKKIQNRTKCRKKRQ